MNPIRPAPGISSQSTPRLHQRRWALPFFGLYAALIACTSVGDGLPETTVSPTAAQNQNQNQSQNQSQNGDLDTTLSKTDQVAALDRLAELLESLYVFPEVGARYARDLRQLSDEEQLIPEDAQVFASAITQNLQEIHADGHLRIEVMDSEANGPTGLPPPPASLNAVWRPTPEHAYLRFSAFWGEPDTMSALGEFADAHADVPVLIIDLRTNRGGGLSEIDLLASELFTVPTDLLVMEVRRTIYDMEGGPFREGLALRKIESPEASVRLLHQALPADDPRWRNTRLVLLTSPTTASAAEHFALAMQRTGRATLIGTPTKGAAHFGGMMPIGAGLQAFIPAGRTYDPDTGESWEGSGVQPDIATAPEDALVRAFEESGLSQAQAEQLRREGVVQGKVPEDLDPPMN